MQASQCRGCSSEACVLLQGTLPEGSNTWGASRTFLSVRSGQRKLAASVAREHDAMRQAHASFRQVCALSLFLASASLLRNSPSWQLHMSAHTHRRKLSAAFVTGRYLQCGSDYMHVEGVTRKLCAREVHGGWNGAIHCTGFESLRDSHPIGVPLSCFCRRCM